jgi:hypothetical protein
MGYLRYSDTLTDKFYNSDGVIILSRTCHKRAYDEMLISLQPLSVLPFQLGLEYVLENSKHLSHSPTLSPNRNKSPLISPSLERNVVIPPPKPARSSNGSGLISTKAWEWIKGGVCEEVSGQKSGAVDSNVVEMKEEVTVKRSERLGEKRSKSFDDVTDSRVQKSSEKEVRRVMSGDHPASVDIKGMTDSFSGIAQKLLGMNTSREKSPETSITKNTTGSGSEKNPQKEKATTQEAPVESVSSKAKSGILKFFDKLLLSKDTGSAPKSQIPKRYSWNVPSTEGQKSPVSMGCKSLSPVSGNKELKNSLEYQKQKFVNARKAQKSKSDSVVARSIQSEATKDSENEATKCIQKDAPKSIQKEAPKCIQKEAVRDDRKAGSSEKSGEKSSTKIRKTPEKLEAVTEKPASKQARNPPSNLNLKLRNTEEDKAWVRVTGSPSKKFGSPQRKVTDKAKVSKIPTLQKKVESKRPHRNSLVLDSSGYSSSSMVSSPTRVKHSYSAGQIPVPVQSPKKTKPQSSKNAEISTTKPQCSKNAEISSTNKEPLRAVVKAPVDAGITSSTEFPISNPTELVESASSTESASLEIGPTLIAPSTQKKDVSQKPTAEKSQNQTAAQINGAQDLDINSNSSLPADQAVGARSQDAAGARSQDTAGARSQDAAGARSQDAAGARSQDAAGQTTNHNKDFKKPDFR